jgi:hypothetical protein
MIARRASLVDENQPVNRRGGLTRSQLTINWLVCRSASNPRADSHPVGERAAGGNGSGRPPGSAGAPDTRANLSGRVTGLASIKSWTAQMTYSSAASPEEPPPALRGER